MQYKNKVIRSKDTMTLVMARLRWDYRYAIHRYLKSLNAT